VKVVLVGAIAIYRSAIDNPQSIIDTVEADQFSQWVRSVTYGLPPSECRTSSEISLLPNSVNERLRKCFKEAIDNYVCRFNAQLVQQNSAFVLLKYEQGQEFKAHNDDSRETPRRISAVGFLNDNFKGGQLSFDLMNFTYEPVAGDIVVFPSNFPYMHGSLPVVDGTKYSVVSWWN